MARGCRSRPTRIAADGLDVVGVQEATRNEVFDSADEAPQKHGLVVQRLAGALAARTGDTWEWCFSRSNPHVPLTPDSQPGGGNALDDLAAKFGNTPDPGDFSEGLGLITRFHIAESRFRHLLPRSYEAAACVDPDPFCRLDAFFDARQVLWARIATPASGMLDMFTTHIAHEVTPLSDTTKMLQVQQAQQIVAEWATPDQWPDFLVGDFNSVPSTDRYAAMLASGYVDTYLAAGGAECIEPGAVGCTRGPRDGHESYTPAPSRAMQSRIDYVWAKPANGCALVASAPALLGTVPVPVDQRWLWASDHLGAAVTTARC